MANLYNPEQVGVTAPAGGFQNGGWYNGRQYWNGQLGDAGVVINPEQTAGYGQAVSGEVNAQSAAQQGVSPDVFNQYISNQNQQSANVTPTSTFNPNPVSSSTLTQQSGTPFTMPAFNQQPTINLPETYKKIQQESGVTDLQKQYSDMERQKIEALGQINDNPFLSEATRVGRVAKLEELFNDRTANIRGQIAQKQADIEMQMNLQTQQYNINSEAARNALDQFNTLLSLGALDNVSGEDIANLTMSTGLSSGMIQAAVEANKAKNVKTSVDTWSDGVNDYFITVDQNGNIVNRQLIGKTKQAQTYQFSNDPMTNSYMNKFNQQSDTFDWSE